MLPKFLNDGPSEVVIVVKDPEAEVTEPQTTAEANPSTEVLTW